MYNVPVTNYPNQKFVVSVPVNGGNIQFKILLRYNDVANYWMATISNYRTNEEYCSSIPLLFSKAAFFDILHQLAYKEIGKCMVYPLEEEAKSMPNKEDLGTNYLLIWGDND